VNSVGQYLEHLFALGRDFDLLYRVDCHRGGKITGGRTAHPVGHYEQMRTRKAGILIVLANQPYL